MGRFACLFLTIKPRTGLQVLMNTVILQEGRTVWLHWTKHKTRSQAQPHTIKVKKGEKKSYFSVISLSQVPQHSDFAGKRAKRRQSTRGPGTRENSGLSELHSAQEKQPETCQAQLRVSTPHVVEALGSLTIDRMRKPAFT